MRRRERARGSGRTSSGMSSRRSRSGGSCDREDVQPVEEVLAETCPRRPARPRSRLVAAITRTSTRMRPRAADALELALLEHAQQLRLQLERQLADLVEEERAAVGQLEAARACCWTAPVKAPFSWPKSSLSSSVAGIAAQLTATNGRVAPRGCARGSRGRRAPCPCPSRRGRAPSRRSARRARSRRAGAPSPAILPGSRRALALGRSSSTRH